VFDAVHRTGVLVWIAYSRGVKRFACVVFACSGPLACSGLKSAAPGADAGFDAPTESDGGIGATAGGFTVVRTEPDGGSLSDVFGFGPNDVHAIGENGVILNYDGQTWTTTSGTTGALLAHLWGPAPNDVYAVGVLAADARGILLHYDGRGWITEREFDDGLAAVWGTKDFVLVGGLNGKVYKKTPTRDWYLLITLEKNPYAVPEPSVHPDDNYMPVVDSLWGNDATHFAAACDLDMTVFYRDPSQWVPEYDPVNRKRRFKKVWGPPGNNYNLFFGANYYGIWQTVGDISMSLSVHEERDTPERVNQFIWGIWGTSSDKVIFVGDKGRIMTMGANGNVTLQPSPTSVGLSAVWGSSPDDVWIVGDEMTILHGSLPK
jgi:hypothetical protein